LPLDIRGKDARSAALGHSAPRDAVLVLADMHTKSTMDAVLARRIARFGRRIAIVGRTIARFGRRFAILRRTIAGFERTIAILRRGIARFRRKIEMLRPTERCARRARLVGGPVGVGAAPT
jgi:hypothetical protein